MPELRWTLLVIGAIFIAVLAWWERRKRGQAPRPSDEQTLSEPLPRLVREPVLNLPEIRVRDREPRAPEELPVVQIAPDDESFMGLRIDGEPAEAGVADEVPVVAPATVVADALEEMEVLDTAVREADFPVVVESADAPSDTGPPSGGSPSQRSSSPPSGSSPSAGDVGLPKLPQAEEPIVDWPPEQERRILALRIVCMGPDRFPGRAVRTALVAEGFMLGKFSIFHKPDDERRAVLSAASLSKPGVFDPDTIDSQRFGGLSVFAVLPGPRSPRETFEDLLATARNLNERLQGGLQDERGSPLTPTRVAALRDGLGSVSGSATIQ
jgi:cell division protein ZipA